MRKNNRLRSRIRVSVSSPNPAASTAAEGAGAVPEKAEPVAGHLSHTGESARRIASMAIAACPVIPGPVRRLPKTRMRAHKIDRALLESIAPDSSPADADPNCATIGGRRGAALSPSLGQRLLCVFSLVGTTHLRSIRKVSASSTGVAVSWQRSIRNQENRTVKIIGSNDGPGG